MVYRHGVGLVLVNNLKQVLVCKRLHYIDDGTRKDQTDRLWQMPQGGINDGETEVAALWREMEEEIGTRNGRIESCALRLLYYEFPKFVKEKGFYHPYDGQALCWFLVKFLGEDEEINVNQRNAEFCAWKWVEVGLLTDLVVEFKKKLYQDVVEMFSWYFK